MMHVLRYYPPLGCEGLKKVEKNCRIRAEDWTGPSKNTRQEFWRLCLCVTLFLMSVLSLLVVEWFSQCRRARRNIFSTCQETVSFYGPLGFTTVFRVVHHWDPSCVRQTQSISPSYPLHIYINIFLPSAVMSLKCYFPAFLQIKYCMH
jgi:hypothetical protein